MSKKISKKSLTSKDLSLLTDAMLRDIEEISPELEGRLYFKLNSTKSGLEADLNQRGGFFGFPTRKLATIPIEMYTINTPYSDSVLVRNVDQSRAVLVHVNDNHREAILKVAKAYEDNFDDFVKRGYVGKFATDRFREYRDQLAIL